MIAKIISAPFIGAGSVSIVEDEFGNVDKIAIYNQGDTSILSGVPEGCFVAIKEPYYIYNNSPSASGEALDFMICVDHPSDVILLRFTDPVIPESLRLGPILKTAGDWRTAGDKAFLEKDYPTAIFWYFFPLSINFGISGVTNRQIVTLRLLKPVTRPPLRMTKYEHPYTSNAPAPTSCSAAMTPPNPTL